MKSSTVTVKGQIVIPIDLRKMTGIHAGTKVFLEEKNGDVIVHPATSQLCERTFGILKGGGLLKALLESRRQEKKHEESKFERYKTKGL